MIEARKKEIRAERFTKYGLDQETIEKIEAIGGQGHRQDNLVIEIIGETLKDLLNIDTVPDWQGNTVTEKNPVAGKSKFTSEEVDELLKDLFSKIDMDALKNWGQ